MAADPVSFLSTGSYPAARVADGKTTAVPVASAASSPSDAEVELAAQQIQSRLQASGLAVDVSVDSKSEQRVVTVRDSANGSVIRQFPSEQAMWLARHIDEGSALLRETA